MTRPTPPPDWDHGGPLAPARGCLNAALAATTFWAALWWLARQITR